MNLWQFYFNSDMKIEEIEREIITEFENFDDWMDKYNLLIDLGKDLPVIDPKYKVKDFLIEGCQSKVWLNAQFRDGLVPVFPAHGQRLHRHRRQRIRDPVAGTMPQRNPRRMR